MIRKLLHILGRAFISFFLGVESCHKINDKQCIVAANHNSHVDIMILFRLFDISKLNKVKTVAAKDYFNKGFKSYVAKMLFNPLLIDRTTSIRKTFEILEKELEGGDSLIVFPEGTRGQPGVINEFKSGIGQLAIDFPDIPIYPVYLSGPEKTLPRGTYVPVPFNISIKILQPIYGKDYGNFDYKERRKRITADIEKNIRTQKR